jgi:hypothetical protein
VAWYYKLLGTFGVTFRGLVRSVTVCEGILCYGTCGGTWKNVLSSVHLGDGALQEYYLNSSKLLYRSMSLMALLSDLDKSLIAVSLLGSCRGNNYGSWC